MRGFVLLVAVLAVGCGGTDPFTGELAIGSAAVSGEGFVEVADGADVELVPGAQGGFHVWTGLRLTGVSGTVYLQREARRQDDGVLILRATRMAIEVPEDAMSDWWESPAAAASFMCPAPIGVEIYDTAIYFDMRITDADENILAADELTVVPRCPAGEQEEFCRSICAN